MKRSLILTNYRPASQSFIEFLLGSKNDMILNSEDRMPPSEILRDIVLYQFAMLLSHITVSHTVPKDWYDLNAPNKYFSHSIEKNQN